MFTRFGQGSQERIKAPSVQRIWGEICLAVGLGAGLIALAVAVLILLGPLAIARYLAAGWLWAAWSVRRRVSGWRAVAAGVLVIVVFFALWHSGWRVLEPFWFGVYCYGEVLSWFGWQIPLPQLLRWGLLTTALIAMFPLSSAFLYLVVELSDPNFPPVRQQVSGYAPPMPLLVIARLPALFSFAMREIKHREEQPEAELIGTDTRPHAEVRGSVSSSNGLGGSQRRAVLDGGLLTKAQWQELAAALVEAGVFPTDKARLFGKSTPDWRKIRSALVEVLWLSNVGTQDNRYEVTDAGLVEFEKLAAGDFSPLGW